MRRIWNPCLCHDPFDNLPDADAAQIPDRCCRPSARFLCLPDPVGSSERIKKLGRHWNGSKHNLGAARRILAFLKRPDRNGSTGKVDPRRGDLQKLGWPTPGPVQGLAQSPVSGGLAPGSSKEGRTFLGVEIKPVSGGVMEAHFGHSEQFTRRVLNHKVQTGPLPCHSAGLGVQLLNTITNSVKCTKRCVQDALRSVSGDLPPL